MHTDLQTPLCDICNRPCKGLGPSTRRIVRSFFASCWVSALVNTTGASASPWKTKKKYSHIYFQAKVSSASWYEKVLHFHDDSNALLFDKLQD